MRDKSSLFLLHACLAFLLSFSGSGVAAPSTNFKKVAIPFMEKNCYECHGGKTTKGDLNLKKIQDDKNILKEQKLWRDIVQQVNSGEMPPKKHLKRPSAQEIDAFNESISATMAHAEETLPPDPGHVTVRRLNRKEYNNTIRDLLEVDFNPSENFPADDIGHGFDNIGDVLNISPVHLERYLDAAETISTRSIFPELPKPATRTTSSNFLLPYTRNETSRRPVSDPPYELFTTNTISILGDYVFQVRAFATQPEDAEPVKMALFMGDKELTNVVVTNLSQSSGRRGGRTIDINLTLPAGDYRFAARFLNPTPDSTNRMLYINEFKVIGPADTRTAFQKRVDEVAAGKAAAAQVHDVVDWFVSRAFRRPATSDEIARYSRVVESGREAGGGKLEAGVQQLIKVVLCSPKFLFRVELDDRPKTRESHPLDEFQLASRLSYFLWTSMPDDELLALARKKQLSANLDAQVRRMLKDPKTEALVKNFGLQWLQLERLATFAPDSTLFPGFDEILRRSMLRETELFLNEIIRQDHSILELVDANFTYVNRPLAQLYGIEDSRFADSGGGRRFGRRRNGGEDFIRVELNSKERGGLLTQASVLTVTSNPTRTSPVKRGKWLLEQILGTPPPPPPPGVATLESQKQLTGTLRQRMEQHRSDARCASCHAQMDAMGFAFENFDAIGRFRSKDAQDIIDPSGQLPDGSKFQGAPELKALLRDKKDLVVRNLTEKMMTYALGRGVEYYDERAIRKIGADVARANYRFSALICGVVESDPFRLRRGTKLVEEAAKSE